MTAAVRAGEYRHRVLVEEPITAQNETGEEIITWRSRGRIWATVEPLSGRESYVANQMLPNIDTKIRTRYGPASARIRSKWRLSHADVIYDIQSILPTDYARSEIEMRAYSGRNRG